MTKLLKKTHWNYRKFLSEPSELFRLRSDQTSDKFATGPAPQKRSDEGVFWKSPVHVAGEQLQEKLQEAVCCQFFQGSVEFLEEVYIE